MPNIEPSLPHVNRMRKLLSQRHLHLRTLFIGTAPYPLRSPSRIHTGRLQFQPTVCIGRGYGGIGRGWGGPAVKERACWLPPSSSDRMFEV